MIGLSQGS